MSDERDGDSASGRAAGASAGGRAFLIADVRGYTRFTREQGDDEAARLATSFAELARDAVAARGGRVVELRGDEALAVFESAAQAVRAATELAAICSEPPHQGGGLALPVGIGIDAGDAVAVGDGFRGAALNTAARLCSQAAGGQVLVTSKLAELAGELSGISFRARGRAELKGLDAPIDVIEALAQSPPRRVAMPGPDEALPVELERDMPLAGREHELAWLRGTWRQALRGFGRVLVVSGPAGIGKTRLAAELAAFALDTGGSVSSTGAGGTAAADAAAAVRAACSSLQPTLLVLDDLDATAETTPVMLEQALGPLERSATLVVCLLRDADHGPAVERLLELIDAAGDGHRRLAGLDADGVRNIAGAYAGADVDSVPLESIGRASRGVPSRVHELVGEWAQAEASRRLAAAAEFLAADRRHRGADLEFANTVIGLKLGRLYREDPQAPALARGGVPYKGLAAFQAGDAAVFFGRERLVGELAARTVGSGLLAVVGASGSGKSSVIAAGLLPSLGAGLLPGSERWQTVAIRPGEHPKVELPVEPPTGERVVLVVDQFEETFTLCADESERSSFIECLVELSADPDRAIVVISLRGDYYGHCGAYPKLARLMAANQVLVGPMDADELRRAIELPARRAGVRVESALTEAIVAEIGAGAGGLPLLSTALVELWNERDDDRLRLAAFERIGGVRGAVARLAEGSYGQLDDEQREAGRRLFLRLVAVGDEGAIARRSVSPSELDLASDAVLASVVERLTADRLLTAHGSSIEVAHEALLREWPRFQEWLAEDEQGRELRDHLIQSARRWQGSGRDDGELYRGARLSATLGWAATRDRELNALERDFLAAGRRHGELDAERQRRQNRRLRVLLVGATGLLVAAVAGGIVALSQRQSAQDHARVALSRQLGAEAIIEPRLDRAMLLAHEAVNLDPSRETSGDLLATLLRSPAAIATFTLPITDRPLALTLSPDGRTLAVDDNQKEVLLYDVTTHTLIRRLPRLGGDGYPFAYTPGGQDAITFTDPPGFGLVDARTGRVLRRLVADKTFQNAATGPVDPILVTPDGNTALMPYAVLDTKTGTEGQAYVDRWDLRSGKTTASRPLRDARGLLAAVLAGGNRFVTLSYDSAITWDAETLRRLRVVHFALPGGAASAGLVAAISADGREAAIPVLGGSLDFVNLASGRVTVSEGGSSSSIEAVSFTPDGRTAVTVDDERQVRIWHPGAPAPVETLLGHAGRIVGVTVSADSRTLFTASLDGAVFEWDLSGRRRFGQLFALGRPTPGAATFAFPPPLAVEAATGEFAVSPSSNARVSIVSAATLKVERTFAVASNPAANVVALASSPRGRELAVAWSLPGSGLNGVARGRVDVWDVSGRPRLLRRLAGPGGSVDAVAWSADGRQIAAIGTFSGAFSAGAGRLVRWDAATGRVVARRERPAEGVSVTFSPDGRFLASGWSDAVLVDDLRTGRLAREIRNVGGPGPVAFAPAGILATGSNAGIVQIWNVRTGKQLGAPTQVAAAPVAGISFDPRGDTFVTSGGSDGVAKLWSTSTLQQLGADFPGAPGTWLSAEYARDGRDVVVVSRSSQGWVWPAQLSSWEAQACRVAGRNLTREEWSRFVGGRSYARVCR